MHDVQQTIAGHIGRWLGISIGPGQYDTMMRNMLRVANELGWGSDQYLWAARLNNNPGHETLRVLAKHITIGETYFFREEPSVDFIRQIIVSDVRRQLEHSSAPYRVWSAACSTGEEPYSLVMLLLDAFPSLSSAQLQVLATDINPEALAKARQGIYRNWSFRTTTDTFRKKFFRREADLWTISDKVRNMVSFQLHNLISDAYPFDGPDNACNLIMCRNVFIYFNATVVRETAERFFKCLLPGGWLVTSQVELNDELFSSYVRIAHGQGYFYRKPLVAAGQKTSSDANPVRNIRPGHNEKGSSSSRSDLLVEEKGNKAQSRPKEQSSNTTKPVAPARSTPDQKTFELSTRHAGEQFSEQTSKNEVTNTATNPESNMFREALQCIEQGQPEQALRLLQQVLFLDPEYHEARFQYAHLLQTLNQGKESAIQYNLLLRHLERMPLEHLIFGGLSAGALLNLIKLALERHE